MKNYIKNNWFRVSIILIFIIIGFSVSYYFVWLPYNKNKNLNECLIYTMEESQEQNETITYDDISKIKKLCSSGLWQAKKLNDNTSKNCNFEISDININRYDFNGPNAEDIRSINWCNKIRTSNTGYIPLSCDEREEHGKNRKDTYYEVEGIIKNNSNKQEYLSSIVSKMYTKDYEKVLLGTDFKDIQRPVASGESVPFKISVYINRNDELIKKYFNESNIDFDTYPWFSTCE